MILRLLILLTTVVLTFGLIEISRNVSAASADLSKFLWKNRLLFIFAPDRTHPFFDYLHGSIKARPEEVVDRELIIFEIFESGLSRVDGTDLDSQTAHALQSRFNIPRNKFAVILVGKDGGIKLNRQEQTHIEEIFSLIDTMPMRQEEMRRKSQSR